MKRYFDHIQSKEPHERRRHALQIAGVVTGLFFIAWITTLGLRLPQAGPSQEELSAAAAQSQLEVAQTSVFGY